MNIETENSKNISLSNPHLNREIQRQQKKQEQTKKTQQAHARDLLKKQQSQSADVEKYLKDILTITDTFNRRLKFSINRELNQVIVKVVDKATDKVIREIPPEELQRLHVRLKEAIGQLFDERI